MLAVGLLAGVLWLQSRATLPDQRLLISLFFLSLVLAGVAIAPVRTLACHSKGRRWLVGSLLLVLAGSLMGISWSGLRAQHRLSMRWRRRWRGGISQSVAKCVGCPT